MNQKHPNIVEWVVSGGRWGMSGNNLCFDIFALSTHSHKLVQTVHKFINNYTEQWLNNKENIFF